MILLKNSWIEKCSESRGYMFVFLKKFLFLKIWPAETIASFDAIPRLSVLNTICSKNMVMLNIPRIYKESANCCQKWLPNLVKIVANLPKFRRLLTNSDDLFKENAKFN